MPKRLISECDGPDCTGSAQEVRIIVAGRAYDVLVCTGHERTATLADLLEWARPAPMDARRKQRRFDENLVDALTVRD